MFKVQFKIIHKGCYGSEIGLTFPNHLFESIDCRWVNNEVVHIIKVEGNKDQFKEIISFLKNRKDTTKFETISKDETTLYVRTFTTNNRGKKNFSNIFFDNNLFTISPTRFEKQYEVWTLGTTKKENIAKVYQKIKRHHPTKIAYLKEGTIAPDLTQKQRETINYANLFGYYEWPRKKSATVIAKTLNMPKTVFLSHLRKAEQKIIKAHLTNTTKK